MAMSCAVAWLVLPIPTMVCVFCSWVASRCPPSRFAGSAAEVVAADVDNAADDTAADVDAVMAPGGAATVQLPLTAFCSAAAALLAAGAPMTPTRATVVSTAITTISAFPGHTNSPQGRPTLRRTVRARRCRGIVGPLSADDRAVDQPPAVALPDDHPGADEVLDPIWAARGGDHP